MKKKIGLILGTFVAGIVLFVLVLKMTGAKDILMHFKEFSIFPFIAYALISFFIMAIAIYRWSGILRAHEHKVRFWNLFSYKLSGFSLSYITPGALIGGEALRAYLLKRDKVPFTHAISSVIIDKFFDLAFAALLTSVGIVLFISFFNISNYYKAVFLILTVVWIVSLSFFIYGALTKKGFFKHIFKFLHLHKIKSFTKIEKKINEIEDHISHFFIHHKKEFRRAAVLSFFLWILMFIEYKLATVVFGYDAGFVAIFLIICMAGFSYTIPVPGALGVLEATQASVHTFLGFKASQGIALSLLIRARDVTWAIIGVILTYFHGVSLAKQLSRRKK